MVPEWEPAQHEPALSAWREVLRPIAAELRAAAPEIAKAAVERVMELIPAVMTDPSSADQMRANAEAGFRAIAALLEAGSDPGAGELPPGIVEGARTRARQGVPLSDAIRTFRIAHERLWGWMLERIQGRDDDALRVTAVALGSTWVFAVVDAIATRYSEVYERERENFLRSAAAVHTETIEAILAGNERDAARASRRLGYELDRPHMAVLAWTDEAHGGGYQEALRAAAERLAGDVHADSVLVEPLDVWAAMAWLSRSTPFSETALASAARHGRRAGPVWLALGEPGAGLEGFVRSHMEATHARRVAGLLRRRPGTLTRYGAVEFLAIATLEPERTRVFVTRTLGPLAAGDDTTRRVAATLAAFLEEGGSRGRTAARLGIHQNTVAYRVRQAESMLGRAVSGGELRLMAALSLLPAVQD